MSCFLGLEIGSPRKTAVVALNCFASEQKAFVSHVVVGPEPKSESADEALLRLVHELKPKGIGVNAPLSLPPCVSCTLPQCPGVKNCQVSAVVWMREEASRLKWRSDPNPYALRPVDILLRGKWQDELSFVVDDSFGANRAPKAARLQYLRKHLSFPLLEVLPRLALAGIAPWYGISARDVRLARDVETGVEHRASILELLGRAQKKVPSLFLYEEDLQLFATDLTAFDALLCALMAFFQELDLLEAIQWEESWGRVGKPLARLER